jgi:DNA-binding SARP family transcriptional activator
MPPLTLTTLGSVSVKWGDQSCPFATRKALALCVYLAVTDSSYSRRHLADLLWPDLDEPHGAVALRQTLARVRRAVGADALPVPYLVATRDTVRFALGDADDLDVR